MVTGINTKSKLALIFDIALLILFLKYIGITKVCMYFNLYFNVLICFQAARKRDRAIEERCQLVKLERNRQNLFLSESIG